MAKKGLHVCPYCGSSVDYFTMLLNEKEGEYTCKSCGRYCNIKMKNKDLAWIIIFVFALIAVVLGLFVFKDSFLGIVFSFLPFLLLYLIIPLFLRLVPIKIKKKPNINENKFNKSNEISSGNINFSYHSDDNDDVKTYIPKNKR